MLESLTVSRTDKRSDAAAEDLQFIRHMMERAVRFNAVPGIGLVLMGATALAAALLLQVAPAHLWLTIWVADATLAFGLGLVAMFLKARSVNMSLASRAGQSFVLSFAPPLLVGVVATVAVSMRGASDLLPGIWLSLYGLAAVTGGAFSVKTVSVMGTAFLLLGAAALLLDPRFGDVCMALGFGVVHIVFGVVIARRHGG